MIGQGFTDNGHDQPSIARRKARTLYRVLEKCGAISSYTECTCTSSYVCGSSANTVVGFTSGILVDRRQERRAQGGSARTG